MTLTPSKGFPALFFRVEVIIQQQVCTPALVSIKQICSVQTRKKKNHDCITLPGFLFLKNLYFQHSQGHTLPEVGCVRGTDTGEGDTDAAQFLPCILCEPTQDLTKTWGLGGAGERCLLRSLLLFLLYGKEKKNMLSLTL